MIKAFLSHSSKDKERYVRIVADYLTKYNIIYDEYTFESGEKTFEEILNGFDETQLFVFFISDESLSSPWVQKELAEVKSRLDKKLLKKVYPLIIEEKIDYSDSRIPEWMRNEYNIKFISRPSVVARKIERKLIQLSWDIYPEIAKRATLFIGRNKLLDEFEERIINFEYKKPKVVIASGLEYIGRRTFLQHAFIKVSLNIPSYRFITIFLDVNDSIEDFILKLNDYAGEKANLKDMLKKTFVEKQNICIRILTEIQKIREKVLIVDNGCIVTHNRVIATWFLPIIDSNSICSYPVICCASKYKLNNFNSNFNEHIYCMNIPELNISERKRLFNSLLELYKLSNGITLEQHDILINSVCL